MRFHYYIIGILFFFGSCSNQTTDSSNPAKEQMDQSCRDFLEGFASEIDEYISLIKQIEHQESNLNLILKRNNLEESIQTFLSDPTLFKCSSDPTFVAQIDSLNALMEI